MNGPDRMREKLRELGRSADPGFAPDLDAKLAEHVKLHGPGVVRRSRQRRALLKASAVVVPFALGVFGWRALDAGEGRDARVGSAVAERGADAARAAQPSQSSTSALAVQAASADEARARADARVRVPATACAQHPVENSTFVTLANGRRVLDLAERGRAVLEKDAEAKLDSSDPCQLALQLVRGRVTVHAKNLLGGELRVQAADADVVVHGTTFAVERVADDISVDVAEGAVAVERGGRALAPLVRDGQRLQVAVRQAPVLLALSAVETARLTAAVSETFVVTQAGASADHVSNAPAVGEAVAERSRTSRSHARVSTSRFGAAQPSSTRWVRGNDSASESAADDAEASASGSAQPIGSAAWQRALADSSSHAPTTLPPSAAAEREASRPANIAASPAHVTTSEARPEAAPRADAAGRSETAERPEAAAGTEPPARTEAPARPETPAELVARADSLWRHGSRDDARTVYRRAGAASGPTAQAAWLSLARRELAAGRASAAREALASYTTRFPSGALSEEAAGIEFRIALLEHDDALAERLARRLSERYPSSPAAQGAARWLRTRGHVQ